AADSLERALRSDAAAMSEEFGVARDVSGLRLEHNIFRYLPVPVQIRSASEDLGELLRVCAAGALSGATVSVSVTFPLPPGSGALLEGWRMPVRIESQEEWLAGLAGRPAGRIRLLGASASQALHAAGGRPDLAIYDHPVTESGRIELLPFLHEQAISVTAHRFGTPV
ncbi:MAG: 1-pyrroline-5-carboxylate dehydrogenase, partial [Solirubrobacteraceae bacterium]